MAAGQRAVKFKAGLQHLGRASLSLVVGVFCFRQSGTFKMSSRETSRDKQADALIPAGTRMTKQDVIRARYSTAWRAEEKITVLVQPAAG